MSGKSWFTLLFSLLILICLLVGGLNYAADPFGAFNDPLLNWYGCDMTNNPRVAKIAWLEQHHQEYDSYIIGCSLTSSFSVEDLNRYFGGNFYNLFVYGSDLYDVEKMAFYVAENYQVENLVVNIGLADAVAYHYQSDPLVHSNHALVEGTSPLAFQAKYLFASPRFALSKLLDSRRDTYLPQSFDVFQAETGSYDKSLRDVEPIGDLENYLAANPVFNEFVPTPSSFPKQEQALASLIAIRDMCAEKGITFTLLMSPLYRPMTEDYAPEDLAELWRGLAGVTDFWDFSLSSLSEDPRYFYDNYHFRNALGSMALAAMFEDHSQWYPEDLAYHVTADNVEERIEIFFREGQERDNERRVPILTYHHLAETGDGAATMSVAGFRGQMEALAAAGYTPVSFQQLIDYVYLGSPLPKRPVVITFDDGYLSNYALAWPILAEYGFPATIFAVGSTVGAEVYPGTDQPITPHFTADQGREMTESGLIVVQSHSFDGHQAEDWVADPRRGVLPKAGEKEADYVAWLTEDIAASRQILADMGQDLLVFSYPHGESSPLAQVLLAEAGVKCTVGTQSRINTLVQGLPQSLYHLGRFSMNDNISPADMLDLLAAADE